MPGFDRLKAAFEAFAAGRATAEQDSAVREAIAAGQVQILSGEHAIQFGRDANGATVITGDRNVVISVGPGEIAALLKALAGERRRVDYLPADLGDFEGRGKEVERLTAILTCGEKQAAVSAIGGMGGVGKSALAVHVAHMLEKEAPDGRVFVDMGGTTGTPFAAVGTEARGAPLTAVEAMVKVVAALAPEVQVAKEEDAAAQAYRSVLDGKRVLLLLDNAEDGAQVRPLLDWRAPTTMVVVTSRRTIAAPGLEAIDLDVMESFDAAAAAAVWDLPANDAAQDLGKLRRRSMVLWDAADNRWRLHDLMRDVAQVALDGQRQAALGVLLEAARARHARHYCGVLAAAGELYLEGGEGVLAGLALYDLEQRNIGAGQAWAGFNATDNTAAATLAVAFGETLGAAHVLNVRLHRREWVNWLEAQRAACIQLGDKQREGAALGNLGITWAALGEPRRAIKYIEQVLEIMREIRDRQGESNALGNLGNAWRELGEQRRAIEFFEQGLAIARGIGDRMGEGVRLFNSALALDALGERAEAVRRARAALCIFEAMGARDRVEKASAKLADWGAADRAS